MPRDNTFFSNFAKNLKKIINIIPIVVITDKKQSMYENVECLDI